jgi:hypothetical protein
MHANLLSACDPEGFDLRTQFEHLYLRRLIAALQDAELPIDAVWERNAIDREKNSIAYEKNAIATDKNAIAREKNDIARLAATRRGARSPSDNPQSRRSSKSDVPYDEDAPWGRKDDGTPYTRTEFLASLDEAVKDIYGIHNFGSTVPDPPPLHQTTRDRHFPSPPSDPQPVSEGPRDSSPVRESLVQESPLVREPFLARTSAGIPSHEPGPSPPSVPQPEIPDPPLTRRADAPHLQGPQSPIVLRRGP